jgi:hypothetical protein
MPIGPFVLLYRFNWAYQWVYWAFQNRRAMLESSTGSWVAYVRLEDPPGLSPITTVGRFATVEAAQLATDEMWASR